MPNNPYPELKKSYDHLIGRTWDLFVLGLKKESVLEELLANSWKNFERIENSEDPVFIKNTANKMKVVIENHMRATGNDSI